MFSGKTKAANGDAPGEPPCKKKPPGSTTVQNPVQSDPNSNNSAVGMTPQKGVGDPNVSIILNGTQFNPCPVIPSPGDLSLGNPDPNSTVQTVTPPSLITTVTAGSHVTAPSLVNTPTTYANFQAGLVADPNSHMPAGNVPSPKSKSKKAKSLPCAINNQNSSASSSSIDPVVMDHIAQANKNFSMINNQFKAINDSIAAINTWMKAQPPPSASAPSILQGPTYVSHFAQSAALPMSASHPIVAAPPGNHPLINNHPTGPITNSNMNSNSTSTTNSTNTPISSSTVNSGHQGNQGGCNNIVTPNAQTTNPTGVPPNPFPIDLNIPYQAPAQVNPLFPWIYGGLTHAHNSNNFVMQSPGVAHAQQGFQMTASQLYPPMGYQNYMNATVYDVNRCNMNSFMNPFACLMEEGGTGRPMERKVISGGLPLGWNVQQAIKERIWSDRYVEFSELLEAEGEVEYGAKLDPTDSTTVWFSKYKRVIRSIKEWDRAFNVYFNVYLQYAPHLHHLPHLVTYSTEIKKMAEDGLNFVAYDETFRRQRDAMVSQGVKPWEWNVVIQAILNDLRRISNRHNFTNHNNPSQHFNRSIQRDRSKTRGEKPPLGFCYEFHLQDRRCSRNPCTFKHVCPCSRGTHPLYQCRYGGLPPPKGQAASAAGKARENSNSNKSG